MEPSNIHVELNTPISKEITLQDIASCKGRSVGLFDRIRNQINTRWNKGSFVTDGQIKSLILNESKSRQITAILDSKELKSSHLIGDLSDIFGNCAKTMLENMEVHSTQMIAVNDLQQAAKKVESQTKRAYLINPNNPVVMSIRSIGYRILGVLASPFDPNSSDYYHFRADIIDAKIDNYYSREKVNHLFEDKWIGGGINKMGKVPKNELPAIMKEKQKLSEKLKSEVLDIDPGVKLTDSPISTILTDGICFGIMMDLAEKYHNIPQAQRSNESVRELFTSTGSKNAEINQGAYGSIKPAPSIQKFIDAVDTFIQSSKGQTSTTLASVLPPIDLGRLVSLRTLLSNPVLNPAWLGKDSLENALFPLNSEEEQVFKNKLTVDPTEAGLNYVINKALNKAPFTTYAALQDNIIHEIDLVFTEKMKNPKADKDYLLKHREQLIGEVKLAIGINQLVKKENISDPLFKEILGSINLRFTEKGLASAKGLNYLSVAPLIGTHLNYRDDAGYLEKLSTLGEGFYNIAIKTKTGGHAISLILEPDGSGHIMDPNNFHLKFDNVEEGIKLMNKLLSQYSQPSEDKEVSYHHLEIYKVEKKESR